MKVNMRLGTERLWRSGVTDGVRKEKERLTAALLCIIASLIIIGALRDREAME